MTVNGVMALILHYFTKFVASGEHCVKVVEDVYLNFVPQKCSPKHLVLMMMI